jgi:hypothetical protein
MERFEALDGDGLVSVTVAPYPQGSVLRKYGQFSFKKQRFGALRVPPGIGVSIGEVVAGNPRFLGL